jgi:hypothetical protein
MKPRWLAPLIAVNALAAILVLGWFYEVDYHDREAAGHREAMERWSILVRSGLKKQGLVEFKGDGIEETFRACFRAGDDVSKYEDLLSTAMKIERRLVPGGFEWRWESHPEGEEGTFSYVVFAKGYPLVIEGVGVHEWLR